TGDSSLVIKETGDSSLVIKETGDSYLVIKVTGDSSLVIKETEDIELLNQEKRFFMVEVMPIFWWYDLSLISDDFVRGKWSGVKGNYQDLIIDSVGDFEIDEFEVFQIRINKFQNVTN
ncbi:5467_t:CDS:2, partial [Dentiscutata heterogama]